MKPPTMKCAIYTRKSSDALTRGMKKASDPNLLRSLMFNRQGILYSPVFTKKHGKRYRYYVSQNVLQFKDYKQAAIDRLPAHEIEEKIEKSMRDQLSSPRNVCNLLNLDWENDQAKLRIIAEKQIGISTRIPIRQAIKRIEIDTDSITMQIDISKLSQVISDELAIGMPEPEKEIKTRQIPYLTCRAHQDVMIVDAEHAPAKDPLDLPPTELKNLIRGTIWRDEHFDGLTIREIAERESFSEAFIGRCIFKSLEV